MPPRPAAALRLVSSCLVAAIALPAAAAPAASAEALAPGVHLVRGGMEPGRQPDGNSVVLAGPEGLVVVDSGRHAEHTGKILDLAAALGEPLRFVVNTHWHLDHIAGNAALRDRHPQVRVLASGALEGALGGFLADYRRQLEGLVAQPDGDPEARQRFRDEMARIDAGPRLAPDEVVTATGRRSLAGREVEIHLEEHAVTAGDLWLLDPASGVLVAGDLVTLPVPFLDTACPRGWAAALDRLAAADFRLLVPGHGEPMDRAAFARYHRGFDALLACAASDAAGGACIDGWFRDLGELAPDTPLARDMMGYYVDRHLRGDAAQTARLCGEG